MNQVPAAPMVSLKNKMIRLFLNGEVVKEIPYGELAPLLFQWREGLLPEDVSPGAYISQLLELPTPMEVGHLCRLENQLHKIREDYQRSLLDLSSGQSPNTYNQRVKSEANVPLDLPPAERAPSPSTSSVAASTPSEGFLSREDALLVVCIGRFLNFVLQGQDSDFATEVMILAGGNPDEVRKSVRNVLEKIRIAQIQQSRGG